jgi:ATP-dependent Clp protease adaptor protein ClpS
MNNAGFLKMSKKRYNKKRYHVVVKNDNTISFTYVIDTLIDVCSHNYYQAGQCASIIHNTGECSVFTATQTECEQVKEDLIKHGLTVELKIL